jgi:hypothetical protein
MFKSKTEALAAFTAAPRTICAQTGGYCYEDWSKLQEDWKARQESLLNPGDTVAFTAHKVSGRQFDQLCAVTTDSTGKMKGTVCVTRPVFPRRREGQFRAKGARYTYLYPDPCQANRQFAESEGLTKSLTLSPDGNSLILATANGATLTYSLP